MNDKICIFYEVQNAIPLDEATCAQKLKENKNKTNDKNAYSLRENNSNLYFV